MGFKQNIVVFLGIILAITLYFLRTKPAQDNAIQQLINSAKSQLTVEKLNEINQLEIELKKIKNKADYLKKLEKTWEAENEIAVAAFYSFRVAELENTADAWSNAGFKFISSFQTSSRSDTIDQMFNYYVISATRCLEAGLALDSTDLNIKTGLAICYSEGQGDMMKGVGILRSVIAENQDHVKANLQLGKYSLMSGQTEKALERFNTVLRIDPINVEALIGAGNANMRLGNEEMALENFKKARNYITDSSVLLELDELINGYTK